MSRAAGSGSRMSARTTFAPSDARRRAYTFPIPCALPVTTATRPCNLMWALQVSDVYRWGKLGRHVKKEFFIIPGSVAPGNWESPRFPRRRVVRVSARCDFRSHFQPQRQGSGGGVRQSRRKGGRGSAFVTGPVDKEGIFPYIAIHCER